MPEPDSTIVLAAGHISQTLLEFARKYPASTLAIGGVSFAGFLMWKELRALQGFREAETKKMNEIGATAQPSKHAIALKEEAKSCVRDAEENYTRRWNIFLKVVAVGALAVLAETGANRFLVSSTEAEEWPPKSYYDIPVWNDTDQTLKINMYNYGDKIMASPNTKYVFPPGKRDVIGPPMATVLIGAKFCLDGTSKCISPTGGNGLLLRASDFDKV